MQNSHNINEVIFEERDTQIFNISDTIAIAKAVRMQGVGHLRSHHVNSQTALIVCGCDF